MKYLENQGNKTLIMIIHECLMRKGLSLTFVTFAIYFLVGPLGFYQLLAIADKVLHMISAPTVCQEDIYLLNFCDC